MYADWVSQLDDIVSDSRRSGVLEIFPDSVGLDVSKGIAKALAQTINLDSDRSLPSKFATTFEVKWTLEILRHGFTLPLSEHETIRDCMTVYCEWLSVLTNPKPSVPVPIADEPMVFVPSMLVHLYRLFVPRPIADSDMVSKQAMFCHRVLRTLQNAAELSTIFVPETWNCLLKFMLAVTTALLAPPSVKSSIGSELCDRVLGALFDIWLLACARSFPPPPLWKAFSEVVLQWRHHEALVIQWRRVVVSLTVKTLALLFGDDYVAGSSISSQTLQSLDIQDSDCLVQTWYRFLHILGDPVELSHAKIIGNTPQFLLYIKTHEPRTEPWKHDCLRELPQIFYNAISTLAIIVDGFLGVPRLLGQSKTMTPQASTSSSSLSLAPGFQLSASEVKRLVSVSQPRINSILHLLGRWLLEASLVGIPVYGSGDAAQYRRRTSTLITDIENFASGNLDSFADDVVSPFEYEAGRAAACGALCRIFSSQCSGETILPVYVTRFCITLHYGLQTKQHTTGAVLTEILLNSTQLFRIDIPGILVLVPRFLDALDAVLREPKPRFRVDDKVDIVTLRRSSIHILLSIASLPLHFRQLPIQVVLPEIHDPNPVTFMSLKKRIFELMITALTIETDSTNTQLLLGGLVSSLQDMAILEETEAAQRADDESSRIPTPEGGKFENACGLFGHTASLVCQRLMTTWKADLTTALASLEVLGTLAKMRLTQSNALMCKRTVSWICDLIVYQSSRPAPEHSRDLHSMLVAAYACLSTWLVEHDYLMHDKECLHKVLEVVELGISGSKSQPAVKETVDDPTTSKTLNKSSTEKPGRKMSIGDGLKTTPAPAAPTSQPQATRQLEQPQLKAAKELKPISQRVGDAADALLNILMDHVGSFPPPCGPEAVYSILNEDALQALYHGERPTAKHGNFHYFALSGSIIVGLLEHNPLDTDELPTLTVVVRSPFGRHAWTMQLRQLPRSKQSAPILPCPRPAPRSDVGQHYNITARHFPRIVDQIPLVKADQSIPPLTNVMTNHQDELDKMAAFINQHVSVMDKKVAEKKLEAEQRPYPDPRTECKTPVASLNVSTARLFLSSLGFLFPEALKVTQPVQSHLGDLPQLTMLNVTSSVAGSVFVEELDDVDSMPSRTCDTVHVFYVKTGQCRTEQILSNVVSKTNVSPAFLGFVRSLGWPVDVRKHTGWTGHVTTSWRCQPDTDRSDQFPAETGGSLYDGYYQVLYWADVLSEIAFVIPSIQSLSAGDRRSSSGSIDSSFNKGRTASVRMRTEPSRRTGMIQSVSLDSEQHPQDAPDLRQPTRRITRSNQSVALIDIRILVVWLECFEDCDKFPIGELLACTSTGQEAITSVYSRQTGEIPVHVIFIHPLQNGLYRIVVRGPPLRSGKCHVTMPLVDGMVVGHRAMGTLVRQTAINICRRRRLEVESLQTPHGRRKVRLGEIIRKYSMNLPPSDFYTQLFRDSAG